MSSSSSVEMSKEINSYFMVTFPHSNGYENLSKSQWDFLFVSIPKPATSSNQPPCAGVKQMGVQS
jgi:hypothetical protein